MRASTENCTELPADQTTAAVCQSGVFAQGDCIYTSGSSGLAWRVTSGSLRLDRPDDDGETGFANLAIKGDIIGAETLLFGQYAFTATALSPCVLSPWPDGCGAPAGDSLLQTLAKTERRAADVIALRCGQAADRVRRLVMLLAQKQDDSSGSLLVTLPPRQDMAEITALTLETVSRMVSGLRRAGTLNPIMRNGFASNSKFAVVTSPHRA